MSTPVGGSPQAMMYRPGLSGVLLNPFYIARAGLWQAIARHAGGFTGRVLDVGCGIKPYRSLFPAAAYVGVDVERRGGGASPTDVLYDGSRLPFADHSFDGVVCSQVLEHVRDVDAVLAEVRRVLKQGGSLLVTVPFLWDEHEQPEDYRRFTSFGLRDLLERHRFVIEAEEKLNASFAAVFQLAIAYLYKITASLPKWLRVPLRPALSAPLTIAGLVSGRVLPENRDMFLDLLLVARK